MPYYSRLKINAKILFTEYSQCILNLKYHHKKSEILAEYMGKIIRVFLLCQLVIYLLLTVPLKYEELLV